MRARAGRHAALGPSHSDLGEVAKKVLVIAAPRREDAMSRTGLIRSPAQSPRSAERGGCPARGRRPFLRLLVRGQPTPPSARAGADHTRGTL